MPVPRAQVLITVPVLSLLGATEEPAMLDGYGPIPPSMARRLVADGADSFHRVLVDPRDGAPLEIGRTSYRLTKAMRHWLRLRDGRCPFPGCNNPSLDNDADHLLAWADGGTTGITNLGQPCRKHHRLKHSSAWTPAGASKDKPPGWTSPVRTVLPQRTTGLGTTPLATRDHCHRDGHGHILDSGLPADPGWDPDLDLPPVSRLGSAARTPSLTGTYSRPDTNSPPRTWRIRPGRAPRGPSPAMASAPICGLI